jgi:hypothetical protein
MSKLQNLLFKVNWNIVLTAVVLTVSVASLAFGEAPPAGK